MGDFFTIKLWAVNRLTQNNLPDYHGKLSYLHPHMRKFTLVLNVQWQGDFKCAAKR